MKSQTDIWVCLLDQSTVRMQFYCKYLGIKTERAYLVWFTFLYKFGPYVICPYFLFFCRVSKLSAHMRSGLHDKLQLKYLTAINFWVKNLYANVNWSAANWWLCAHEWRLHTQQQQKRNQPNNPHSIESFSPLHKVSSILRLSISSSRRFKYPYHKNLCRYCLLSHLWILKYELTAREQDIGQLLRTRQQWLRISTSFFSIWEKKKWKGQKIWNFF